MFFQMFYGQKFAFGTCICCFVLQSLKATAAVQPILVLFKGYARNLFQSSFMVIQRQRQGKQFAKVFLS